MADYDKLVESFFQKKENVLEVSELNKIIQELVKNNSLLNEFSRGNFQNDSVTQSNTVEQILKLFPKFEFSQTVGKEKENISRKEFEKILQKGVLSQGTLESKIQYLSAFSKEAENIEKINTDEILSNLMLLKTLAEIKNDFTPSTAGYMFESFMSVLLGGTLPEGNPLEDIVIGNGEEYISLKVIDEKTPVKGSVNNASKFFKNNKGKTITYIIIYKKSNSIEFFKMPIKDAEAFEKITGAKLAIEPEMNKDISKNSQPSQDQLSLPMQESLLLEAEQFRISKQVVLQNSKNLGEIFLDTQKIMNKYGQQLKGKIYNTFIHLAELTDNINRFYLNNDPAAAGVGAQKAKQLQLDLSSEK